MIKFRDVSNLGCSAHAAHRNAMGGETSIESCSTSNPQDRQHAEHPKLSESCAHVSSHCKGGFVVGRGWWSTPSASGTRRGPLGLNLDWSPSVVERGATPTRAVSVWKATVPLALPGPPGTAVVPCTVWTLAFWCSCRERGVLESVQLFVMVVNWSHCRCPFWEKKLLDQAPEPPYTSSTTA